MGAHPSPGEINFRWSHRSKFSSVCITEPAIDREQEREKQPWEQVGWKGQGTKGKYMLA